MTGRSHNYLPERPTRPTHPTYDGRRPTSRAVPAHPWAFRSKLNTAGSDVASPHRPAGQSIPDAVAYASWEGYLDTEALATRKLITTVAVQDGKADSWSVEEPGGITCLSVESYSKRRAQEDRPGGVRAAHGRHDPPPHLKLGGFGSPRHCKGGRSIANFLGASPAAQRPEWHIQPCATA